MNRYLKEIICIVLTLFFIVPTFIVTAEKTNSISWVPITENGFENPHNTAIRGIGIYKGDLYIGTENHNRTKKLSLINILELSRTICSIRSFRDAWPYYSSLKSDGCEIWKYNGTTSKLQQVVGKKPDASMKAGFGNTLNTDATFIKEFKDKLYVGTRNSPAKGCEVWRYGNSWEQVVKGGFGDPSNYAAWSVEIFKGQIYIGTMNWNDSVTGFCQIWRSSNGENWTKVADRGFRDFDTTEKTHNIDARAMMVYKDWLYVGTSNRGPLGGHKGCQLWKTSDGTNWSKVELPGGDGFGEAENDGIFSMEIYNNWLYVGTAILRHNHGFEIWKYNGTIWIPMIGDDVLGVKCNPWNEKNDGFGDRHNVYAFSMINSSNKLWVGTVNTKGCEIYCFNGTDWTQIVGDNKGSEMGKGFGNQSMIGVRSMIEYPIGSGNIFVGTSKAGGGYIACQLWMRKAN